MKTRTCLLSTLLILLFSITVHAQLDTLWHWEADGGLDISDRFESSIEIEDGSIVSTGFVNTDVQSAQSDGFIMKHGSDGELIWNNVFEMNGFQAMNQVIEADDGGFILVGLDRSNSSSGWIVKTDSEGVIDWTQHFGLGTEHYLNKVIETQNNNILLCGTVTFGMDDTRIWSIMLDSSGTEIWNHNYEIGQVRTWGNGVVETSDGNFFLAGTAAPDFAGSQWPIVVKIDSDGDTLWTEQYPTDSITSSWINSCQINENQDLIIGACYVPTTLLPRTGLRLMNINSDGEVQIDRLFYFSIFDNYCWDATQTNDNGYLIFGHSAQEEGSLLLRRIVLIRTDENGDTLYTRLTGQQGFEEIAYCGFQCSDGSIIIAGEKCEGEYGTSDFSIMKVVDPLSPVLELSSEVVIFDTVFAEGETTTEELIISNTGNSPLIIDSLDLDVPFSCDYIFPDTIAANESITVPLIFTPLSSGEFADTMTINSNIAGIYQVIIEGVCDVNSVPDANSDLPESFSFNAPYPNPFNSSTLLTFTIPKNQAATLSVYNVMGQLLSKEYFRGTGEQTSYSWHPDMQSSGILFLKLELSESGRNIIKKGIYAK